MAETARQLIAPRARDPAHPLNREPFPICFEQPCSVKRFQGELDKLFGLEVNGRPRLRIIWGASSRTGEDGLPEAMDWDPFGENGAGEWRARYIYSSRQVLVRDGETKDGIVAVKAIWVDVGIPRFFLERYIPPDVACLGFVGRGREDGLPFTSRPPVEGLWEPLEHGMIAEHDPDGSCCRAARLSERRCLGYFGEPGQAHLEALRRAHYEQMQEAERRPGPSTADELARSSRRSRALYQQWAGSMEERMRDRLRAAMRTHSHRFSDDPGVLSHGKWHFLSAHNRSGSPITYEKPEEEEPRMNTDEH